MKVVRNANMAAHKYWQILARMKQNGIEKNEKTACNPCYLLILQKKRKIMILSMTGYGKYSVEENGEKITVEIKSLNSKQLDLSMRLPTQFREYELAIRALVAQRLERGKVEVVATMESIEANAQTSINLPVALKYKAEIESMASALSIQIPENMTEILLRMPEVLKPAMADIDDSEKALLRSALDKAIDRLVEFRTQEGNRLEKFFVEKIAAIQQLLNEVPQYEAERIEKIKKRIQEALEKLGEIDFDKNRFEQELIFYIEKLDIAEEKLRLQNHLDYFLSTMEKDPGQGKKLGFIAQEMGREINTLGSKANHAELQRIVVRMKDHLEQMKEQILNVM